MADRTCPSCGAAVSATSAFCARCGADLAVDLVQLGAGPVRRPSRRSAREPRRPGARRVVTGAVLAGAVAVGAVSLLGGDDGDGERGDATTTTTTDAHEVVVPPDGGPMLGEETGLSVALTGQAHLHVDLDRGELVFLDSRIADVYGDQLVVADGLGVRLASVDDSFDGGVGFTILDERPALDAFAGDSVIWSVDRDGRARALRTAAPTGVLADRYLAVPEVAGVLGDELVVGGPGGTFLVGTDGTAGLLSTGSPLAVGDDVVAVAACEGDLVCEVRTVDRAGSVVQSMPLVPEATVGGRSATVGAVSPEGSVAWILDEPGGGGMVVVDGRLGFSLPTTAALTLDWSPDGRWLAGALDRGTLWFLDTAAGPDARPMLVDLGRFVYPEEVRFVPG